MVLPQKMQQCRLNDSRFYLNPNCAMLENHVGWWFSPGYCTSHRIGRCHPRTLLLKNQHQGLVNVPWLGDFVEHHLKKYLLEIISPPMWKSRTFTKPWALHALHGMAEGSKKLLRSPQGAACAQGTCLDSSFCRSKRENGRVKRAEDEPWTMEDWLKFGCPIFSHLCHNVWYVFF